MAKLLTLVLISIYSSFFQGCSTMEDKVVHTMDGADRPKWATLSRVTYSKNGDFFVVGMAEASASARITALIRMSGNNARSELSRIVTNNMNFIYQNVEEGVENSARESRFYGSEVSGFLSNSIYPVDYFWEKVLVSTGLGEKELRIRAYSLISIKEGKLKKSIKKVLNNDKQLSPQLRKKIDEHMSHQVNKLMQG